MSDEGHISRERRGHVYLMGLDRVSKRNAFDLAMLRDLAVAYGELDRDDDLRCGVLFAHGDHFTGGIDLAQFAPELAKGRIAEYPEGGLDPLGLIGPRPSKPIICAVQGICFTIGIELMLATDVRVASETTRFSQLEVKRGIFPTGGATVRFVREAGWGNAMRYLLTGDEFSAAEAVRMGLVQEVAPVGEYLNRAIALAETIAAQAPLGVQAVLASSRLALAEGDAAAFAQLFPAMLPIMQSDDAREGVQSFLERRAANFTGR